MLVFHGTVLINRRHNSLTHCLIEGEMRESMPRVSFCIKGISFFNISPVFISVNEWYLQKNFGIIGGDPLGWQPHHSSIGYNVILWGNCDSPRNRLFFCQHSTQLVHVWTCLNFSLSPALGRKYPEDWKTFSLKASSCFPVMSPPKRLNTSRLLRTQTAV